MTPQQQATVRRAVRILERQAGYHASAEGTALTSPAQSRELCFLHLATEPEEVFAAAFLNNRHGLIAFEPLFRGTIDGASVHARVVVRRALALNAAAVVFAHNHPSGVTEPSQSDLRITQRLKDALALIDVRVLDHLIVGQRVGETTSLAERGLLSA